MALTSFVQTAFFGGEISQSAQGRMDLPSYKVSLNVCINAIPTESGTWMRRPGTRLVAPTRSGKTGRLIPFAFAQNFPYVMEFTDGFLRFTTGPALAMTNDAQVVTAISTANPAQVTTATPHGWSTGNSVAFNALGVNNPLLQNRQFTLTKTGAQTFTLTDAITGATIDGSTLGAFASGNVTRVLEIATVYTAGSWSAIRSVQAETRTVLLNGSNRPQVLQVATPPAANQFATFTLGPADFIDGPYLDPIAGSLVTSSALNGVVTMTFSFASYDATVAYNIGDFVSFFGQGYKSLTSPNQGDQPDTHPANWLPVNGGAAVNNGQGFVTSDVGRLIRLFSEPQLWNPATAYPTGAVVAYADGNGGFSYWTASTNISGGFQFQPGISTTWSLNATGGLWTWAEIVGVSGSGLINSVNPIGSMTAGGGLASAFDGTASQAFASSAASTFNITTYPIWTSTSFAAGTTVQYNGFAYQAVNTIDVSSSLPVWVSGNVYSIGNRVQSNGVQYTASLQNFDVPPPNAKYWVPDAVVNASPPPSAGWALLGAMSSPQLGGYVGQHYIVPTAIQSAIYYPTADVGISNTSQLFTINLRAKNTAPSSQSDGTLIGTASLFNLTVPVTIISTDQVSTWPYVWFELVVPFQQPLPDDGSHNFVAKLGCGQAQFYSPNINNGSVITAQIRGPALLYSLPIRTWRAGVYSDTTGWPTCGTYHEGRIWLGGVVSNRFDASVSNGLNGARLNFAPTGPSGIVSDNNAISYVCTGEDSNQILWMTPDQQGVLFGTKAGEWLISAPASGALAPANIKAVRVTKIGCADIEPRRAEHTLLIVQKFGRKVVEYFADVFSGKFTAPNLSERAKHLTVNGIAEIAYQQELAPIMWARRNDGALIGATYKRDTLTTSQGPTIIGWHRHQLGSGRTLESLCTGPSVGGNLDTLSMITNDAATGIRHIEVMTDLLDEGFALSDCWFLDDGIVPSSTVIQAAPTGGTYGSLLVNGLTALNGKTVTAFIAGLDCGDYLVTSGSITVPFGDSISGGTAQGLFTASLVQSFTALPAVVGFTYNSDGQLVRPVTPADTGAQAGPGFAKIGRLHRVGAQLYGAVNGSISFGSDFATMDPIRLRFPNDVPYTIQQRWSGIARQEFNSTLDFDGRICWRISRPYPAFVIAVGGFDSKADA